MRKLEDVIDKMLELIPVSEDRLRRKLESNRRSILYCSPEGMSLWWREVGLNLQDRFCEFVDGVPQAPKLEPDSWEEIVSEIFTGKRS